MNKLAKNYTYNVLYQVFIIIVPLITAPYLARVLGATQLGTYSYINSISSIITNLGLLGLNNYGIRQIAYYREDKELCSRLFWQLMSIRVVLLLIISILYSICIINSEYKQYFILQYFLILSVFIDISWLMIGEEDIGIVTFRNFVAKFITVVCIFFFVKKQSDLWVYFSLYSIITLITTVSLFPYARKYIIFKKISISDSLSHISQSIQLFLPQVAIILYLQVDKIMLKIITQNTEQISFYDQAEKIIMIPLAVITALGLVMMPRLAAEHKKVNTDAIKRYVNITIRFSLFLAFPMMFGIMSIAPTFVPWYLGREFSPTIIAIITISPIILANTLTNISGTQYFTATNQIKIMTIAYSVTAVINILLNTILIPNYGYVGTAIATLMSAFACVIVQYWFFNKQMPVIKTIIQCWVYFVIAAIMGLICWIIGCCLGAKIHTTIIQILIGSLFYLSCLFLFKDNILFEIAKRVFIKIQKT